MPVFGARARILKNGTRTQIEESSSHLRRGGGLMEAATAGEYDENPEQMLRMLQRRGEDSIKQTNRAVKFGVCSFASKRLVVACRCVRSPVGVWRWLLLSWRAHEFNTCRMRTTRHESRSLR